MLLEAACVEVIVEEPVLLLGGTAVVSSDSQRAAYVLDEDSAGLLTPPDARVSYFDCPPNHLGLEPGWLDYGGAGLIPDSAADSQPRPLYIGKPLLLGADEVFRVGDQIAEIIDVRPDCASEALVLRTPIRQLERRNWVDSSGIQRRADDRILAGSTRECAEAVLENRDLLVYLVVGESAELVSDLTVTLDLFLSIDCSGPYPRVAVAGTSFGDQLFVALITFTPSGPTTEHWTPSDDRSSALRNAVVMFDPLNPARLIVSERVGFEERIYEIVDSQVQRLEAEFVRAVGTSVLVVTRDQSFLREPTGETELRVCENPSLRVVDISRVPGRWLYVTQTGALGESASLLPCLEAPTSTDLVFSPEASPRLITLPHGTVVAGPAPDRDLMTIRGWVNH